MDHRIRELIASLGERVADRDRKARLSELSSWLDDDKYVDSLVFCLQVRQCTMLLDQYSNLRVLDDFNARRSKNDKEKSGSCGWDVCTSMRSMSYTLAKVVIRHTSLAVSPGLDRSSNCRRRDRADQVR